MDAIFSTSSSFRKGQTILKWVLLIWVLFMMHSCSSRDLWQHLLKIMNLCSHVCCQGFDIDVVLLKNDTRTPEFGWQPISIMYNANTKQLTFSINYVEFQTTTINLPTCAFVNGLGANAASSAIDGIYRLLFFDALLTSSEINTIAGK